MREPVSLGQVVPCRRVSSNTNNFNMLSRGAEVGVWQQRILARMWESWCEFVVRKVGKEASGKGTAGASVFWPFRSLIGLGSDKLEDVLGQRTGKRASEDLVK